MNVNFDLLVSGCNTRCAHCYVNGGPGRNMPTELALECIEKLDSIAALLPEGASFTLDNEPFNHPDIASIIRAAASVKSVSHYHHGMTTGVALMGRKDREEAVAEYLSLGFTEFGITLHGAAAHHDEIVGRRGAFGTALCAAEFLKACGAEVGVSLLLNRFFEEDAEELERTVTALSPEYVYFGVPNYTPHANMWRFDGYRASIKELYAFAPVLERLGVNAEKALEKAGRSTVGAAVRMFENGLDVRELFEKEQDELYLSVRQDGRLYIGNTGAETRCMGELVSLEPESAAETIRSLPGNRDYGAFYDMERLPETAELVTALKRLPADSLYDDISSVVCRGLAELGVRTKILAISD